MAENCRSRAELVIAVDDTDCPGEGGTGRVGRMIGDRLAERFGVWGVTRHQLAVLPEINYTSRNSANVAHLLAGPADLSALAQEVSSWVAEMALEGSEPGLCIARVEALLGCELGHEAQQRFVTREEVRGEARGRDVWLGHVLEEDGGIVGAFCGACLAAGGNDGRFVQVGRIRSLCGEIAVDEVLAAGVDEVRTTSGELLREGNIIPERLRPALVCGKCVAYVERMGEGRFAGLKGRPGDE